MINIRNCCQKIFGWKDDSELLDELKKDEEDAGSPPGPDDSKLNAADGLSDTRLSSSNPALEAFVPRNHRKRSVGESESIRNLFQNEDFIRLYESFFQVFQEFGTPAHKFKDLAEGEVEAAEQFAANLPTPEGPNVNVLVQKFRTKYSAQFCMFANLNQLVNLFPNIEESEILHYESHPDVIYLIERAKTKKVALFASRQTVTLRIIKALDANKYIDLSRSIQLTPLADSRYLAKSLAAIDKSELATVFVAGSYYENKDGVCECISLTKINFLSTVSLKIGAFFLNMKFGEYIKNLDQNLRKNADRSHPEGYDNIIWFKDPDRDREAEPEFATTRDSILASKVASPP